MTNVGFHQRSYNKLEAHGWKVNGLVYHWSWNEKEKECTSLAITVV